jgi:glycosyltransferase involved in cell wall biosynthesis
VSTAAPHPDAAAPAQQPRSISVLIPAYNSSRFFPAAIESVLRQTHREFELILIDDGSTDDTLAIARRYAGQDARIRVISHENFGMGRSLNHAMEQARGNWIARLDADDVMLPQRLERQLAFLAANPDLAVASSFVRYIDDGGRDIGAFTSVFTTRAQVQRYVANHWAVGFHHPAAIFHKQTIQSLGGYRPQFWPAEDLDLWNRVIDAGHGVLVQDEALTCYRIHGGSVMVSKSRSAERKVQWATACIRARHEARPEPSEAEFLAERRNRPVVQRVNESRREVARALYKSAVFHFSQRRWAKCAPTLAAALVMEPGFVLPRLRGQLRRKSAPHSEGVTASPGAPEEARGEGAGGRGESNATLNVQRSTLNAQQNQPHASPVPECRERGPQPPSSGEEPLNVLMPVYNCARFVAAAIDSVLAQTHQQFTLHIVDDGSTDNTLEICRQYQKRDARIALTSHANRGIANTMNEALDRLERRSPGGWVFCMHGDDVMLPNRLERQLAFVRANPDLAAVSALVRVIDEHGREVGVIRSPYTTRTAVAAAAAAGRSIAFNHPAAALRPAAVLAAGGYRQDFWPAEDTELWNRLACGGWGVLVQDEYLLQYRIHGKSASTAKARLMIRKLAWTTECLQRRLEKKPEPTWDQFIAGRRQAPWWVRVNQGRKETSRTLYQAALHALATRRYHVLAAKMSAAAVLEPTLVLRRVMPRIVPGG